MTSDNTTDTGALCVPFLCLRWGDCRPSSQSHDGCELPEVGCMLASVRLAPALQGHSSTGASHLIGFIM